MLKHRLLENYPCSVVPGCPNKAKIFSDSLNNNVLSCRVHRQALFTFRPADSRPKQMFSKADPVMSKYLCLIADFSYEYVAREHAILLKKYRFDACSELAFFVSFFKYLTTELRLFWFYGKLAHFQAPCREEVQIIRQDFHISDRGYNIVLDILKDLIEKLFICPLFQTNQQMINSFLLLKKLFYKRKHERIGNKVDTKMIEEIIGKNGGIALECLELPNYNLLYLFHGSNLDRIICHIINPSLINYLSPQSEKKWLNLRAYLRETVGLRLSNIPVIDRLNSCISTGLLLYHIGEFKNALKSLKQAENELEKRKKWITTEKYNKILQRIYFYFGSVYFDAGIIFRAQDYFKKYSEIEADNMYNRIHFCLAYRLIKRRKFKSCFKFMKKFKNEIEKFDYWELKANCYYGLGDLCRAKKICKKIKYYNRLPYIQYYLCAKFKYRRIRISILKFVIRFYQGEVVNSFHSMLNKNYIEAKFLEKKNMLAAQYYLYLAQLHEDHGSYEEAVSSIEKSLKLVKKSYTEYNFIYVEILLRACSIYFNTRKLTSAVNILALLLVFKKNNRHFMEPYYELDILIGQYLFLTQPIEEIKHRAYKRFARAREKIKRYHGYNTPAMISLNLLIGKLYMLDSIKLLRRKFKNAYSVCQHFQPDIDFHPFKDRMSYEYAAIAFKLRKFDETIILVKGSFEAIREREKNIGNLMKKDEDFRIIRAENYEIYRRKMRILLLKICVFRYFASALEKIIRSFDN